MKQFQAIIISLWLLLFLIVLYQIQIMWLNWLGSIFTLDGNPIQLWDRWSQLITDIIIWLTIYLKTSIDFALLIGILMEKYPWFKNQIIIQSWTTLGNAIGTMVVLIIWFFFKEVYWLLALMIFFASLVLIELAQTSLAHIIEDNSDTKIDDVKPTWNMMIYVQKLYQILHYINQFTQPVTSKVLPDLSFDSSKKLTVWWLMIASFSVPFILGMDDFAWYVPLFDVINVFGFGIWVFLGHTILTCFLFISPSKTVTAIKNPIVAIFGSLAFIGIAIWWLYDSLHIIWINYILPIIA